MPPYVLNPPNNFDKKIRPMGTSPLWICFIPAPKGGGRGVADGGHRVAGVATAVAQRRGTFVEGPSDAVPMANLQG